MNFIAEQSQRQFDIAGGEPTLQALALEVNELHQECERAARTAIDFALQCGEALTRAKEAVLHGQWETWLKDNCPTISMRTAQGYMRLATNRSSIEEAKAKPASHLTIKDALKLLAEPKPTSGADDILDLTGPVPSVGHVLYGVCVIDDHMTLIKITHSREGHVDVIVGDPASDDLCGTRGPVRPEFVHPQIGVLLKGYDPADFRWSEEQPIEDESEVGDEG